MIYQTVRWLENGQTYSSFLQDAVYNRGYGSAIEYLAMIILCPRLSEGPRLHSYNHRGERENEQHI